MQLSAVTLPFSPSIDRVATDQSRTAPSLCELEVRSYELPLGLIRPITSDLQQAYNATLDFIADKFFDFKITLRLRVILAT